jgi:hypothetical protein
VNSVLPSRSWVAHHITVQSFSNLLSLTSADHMSFELAARNIATCTLHAIERWTNKPQTAAQESENRATNLSKRQLQHSEQCASNQNKESCGELPQNHGTHSGGTTSILGCLSPPHDDSDKDLHCISLMLSSCQRTKLVHS